MPEIRMVVAVKQSGAVDFLAALVFRSNLASALAAESRMTAKGGRREKAKRRRLRKLANVGGLAGAASSPWLSNRVGRVGGCLDR